MQRFAWELRGQWRLERIVLSTVTQTLSGYRGLKESVEHGVKALQSRGRSFRKTHHHTRVILEAEARVARELRSNSQRRWGQKKKISEGSMLVSRVRSLLVSNGVAILSFSLETAVITLIVGLLATVGEGSFKLLLVVQRREGQGGKGLPRGHQRGLTDRLRRNLVVAANFSWDSWKRGYGG